ncbi:hypothetical protein ANAPC5_01436 [Anaplasma phagocytophilum]|nr:hypothetical protein ANAPC5_01436 [Anaplasma phagocytophilum]
MGYRAQYLPDRRGSQRIWTPNAGGCRELRKGEGVFAEEVSVHGRRISGKVPRGETARR